MSTCTSAFSQPATGPSSVCEGSDVTLQCVIVQTNPDNTTAIQNTLWSRNGMSIQLPDNSFIPNHSTVFNSTTGAFTDLVITNVTLEYDNTVYSCTAASAVITSSVVLNVSGNVHRCKHVFNKINILVSKSQVLQIFYTVYNHYYV